jgi:hypothetical protein
MARSKAQLTHAKRAREIARQEKRVRKQEKKDARKLAAANPGAETEPLVDAETEPATDIEGEPAAADTESQTP